jgi:nicotinamide-nucleotide amidase
MNAAIITVGDEILIGQITDTNSAWLASKLNLLGIKVDEIISVSDSPGHIVESLSRYIGKKDLILITGGLGPTKDDLTKKTLSEYFGMELKLRPEVLKHIENLFSTRSIRISESNRLQAMLPENCKVLHNPSGTAAGMWFEKEGSVIISLPGVPYELMDIYSQSLLPELQKIKKGSIIVHRTIMTQGVPESILSDRISSWEDALPANIKLAYLPKPGLVRLRLSATGDSADELNELLEVEISKLLKIIDKDVFSTVDMPIERVIAGLLTQRSQSISTAESCTGGTIASMITSVPGSSKYFKGGIIAYDNDVKTGILKVKQESLSDHGAVSQKVVEEMAISVREILNTDFSIATSGIAGPDGGTAEKQVGTVWIAVSSGEKTISRKFLFGEHRGRNIEKASQTALNMLRKMILALD